MPFQTNLFSVISLTQKLLPLIKKSDAGRIINISSTEGFGATPYNSPYTAAKHGVIGLTRSLALELGPQGITVNCICPGPINTNMTAKINEKDLVVGTSPSRGRRTSRLVEE